MRLAKLTTVSIALAFIATSGRAQAPGAPTPDSLPRPAARPADVSSPDAILTALYDVISGGAGVKRDWDRFRSLFVPYARLIPSSPLPSGGARATVFGVEDYIRRAGPGLMADGFFEVEVNRTWEQYGNIAHASPRMSPAARPTARRSRLRAGSTPSSS